VGRAIERETNVFGDVLLAILITAIAVVLGLTVHPLLFFLVILAIVYLFARRGRVRA
jgi:pilus assembly protein TadC